jgi:hypothetical protein
MTGTTILSVRVKKMLELRQGKYESIKKYLVRSQEIYNDIDLALEKFFIKNLLKVHVMSR